MTIEVFKEKMMFHAEKMEISLENNQIEKFYMYMKLLIEWNEKINLTAIIEPEEIIVKHFIDSITIAKDIKKNATVIDVGTGAGFPGIPLKILREDIKITLLDSLNKRIKFLDLIIEELKLGEINALHGRAEEFAHNEKYREQYDVATSRAVANLSVLTEYLLPFVKKGGLDISMKGSEIQEELEVAGSAIEKLGGEIEKVETFSLPNSDMKRSLVIIRKVNKTDKIYPRKAGTPTKEPLK